MGMLLHAPARAHTYIELTPIFRSICWQKVALTNVVWARGNRVMTSSILIAHQHEMGDEENQSETALLETISAQDE